MADDAIIPARLTAATVRSYIDFDGHAARGQTPSLQAQLQSEGVAGLWELLRMQGHAYLGDEVGMGKTRQAMGVIATQFLHKPDSRVVIVCPSRTVQVQWQSEWAQFLRSCYRLLDDRLLATADASQIEDLHLHERLSDLHEALRIGEGRIHLLRYSSFSIPLSLDGSAPGNMLADYAAKVGLPGVEALTDDERALALQHAGRTSDWQDELGHALGRAYCRRIGAMLTEGAKRDADGAVAPVHPLDLVVFDEAQYLRHLDNYRNEHIRLVFGRNVRHWLFLSATPLHAGEQDLHSLDAYLCHHAPVADENGKTVKPSIPEDCGSCTHAQRCSRVRWEAGRHGEVVDILHKLMIRRIRTYGGADRKRYAKIEYRHYAQVRHSGLEDPLLALTMALVQKRLVGALAGRNNRFRQGECASFESLSSSLGRQEGIQAQPEFEPAKDHRQSKQTEAAPDRNAIDDLNRSFIDAMHLPAGAGLPHAKVNGTVRALFGRSLAEGSTDKTLVFVRRLDTVEELRDRLHLKFQGELDDRIRSWREFLVGSDFGGRAEVWKGRLWDQQADNETSGAESGSEEDGAPGAGDGVGNVGYLEQVALPYFEALQQRPKGRSGPGLLYAFRSQLLRSDEHGFNPLQRFLLRQPDSSTAELDRTRWDRLLAALFGSSRLEALRSDPAQAWLFAHPSGDGSDAYKLASLQLCLLQSIRQTELLVDLFILHRYVKSTPHGARTLADKLLWLFEDGSAHLPAKIGRYVDNQKEKLRRWILNFDLIVDKCFRRGGAADWKVIHGDRILKTFARIAPVVVRSGRLHSENAVQQFMFPTHPNVLVCTDVLKEGVDMHLFCDRVVHYGVAWTAGDLEQRIGRVDRLGSLISRRIAAHTKASGDALPRLGVEFPYLDGTLDMYQVRNVIREKMVSDQRLDLGKRKNEIREFDAASLTTEPTMHDGRVTVLPEGGVVFFPESVRFVRDEVAADPLALREGMRFKTGADVIRPRKPIDDRSSESVVPVPGCDAVLVRRPALLDHALTRRSICPDTKETLLTEDCIALRSAFPAIPAVGRTAVQAGIEAVAAIAADGFRFDGMANTCVMRVVQGDGSGLAGNTVPALVEALGERFWLLRVPVQRTADSLTGRGGIDQWLAERNTGRSLGFLMQGAGIVWCAAIVLRIGGSELPLLTQLAPQLARMTARWRSPGVAAGTFGYRAWTSFPRVEQTMFWKDNMNQIDVVNCGRVLAGVQAWFSEAFEAVFNALYDDEGRPAGKGLTILPLTLLPGGVLHLQTDGRERFRLQAFLDPTGATSQDPRVRGPRVWWELVASPKALGARPDLPFSDIDGFPHVDADGWEGNFVDGVGAFTGVDDSRYRYVAHCHRPADLDRCREALVDAWRDVRDKLRTGGNFQRQWCREALCNAVALPDEVACEA